MALGVALEIARRRPGLLARLSDDLYEKGLRRLEAAVEEQGEETVIPSEVTLVKIVAARRIPGQPEEADAKG